MKKEIIKEEKDISLEDIEKVAEFFKDILKDTIKGITPSATYSDLDF